MDKNFFDYNKNLNHSYLTGIVLAVNAIDGAGVFLDSPDCAGNLTDLVYHNHDFFSTLVNDYGVNKVLTTEMYLENVGMKRDEIILGKLEEAVQGELFDVLFFSSMPVNTIMGEDYSLIIKKIKNKKTQIIELPSKSLSHDWLDGYKDLLMSIANGLSFSKNKKVDNTIGIVGYFMDRREGDHVGNINEIRRYCSELSIDLSAVWLDGSSLNKLRGIEKASLIVAFEGYGDVAIAIAKKTGADYVEVQLPFGLDDTKKFIETIANYFSKSKDANVLIKKETKEISPIISRVVDFALAETSFTYFGDPFWGIAFYRGITSLGGKFDSLIFFSRERKELVTYFNDSDKSIIQFSPNTGNVVIVKSDVYIGNSILGNYVDGNKIVPVGFPSVNKHYFYNHPHLGYKGFVVFVNMIYDILRSVKF